MGTARRLILPVGYAGADREARAAMRLSALRDEGWRVTVYTPGVPAVDTRFSAAGIDVRHLPMRGLSDYLSIRHLAGHFAGEAEGACVLAQSFRTAFIALCARKLARRPDMKVTLIDRSRTAPKTTWLARRVYRNLSAIFFTSHYSMSLFRHAGQRQDIILAPPERLHMVRESVGDAPPPAPEPKGPVMAIYTGELRHGCGLGRLIDALPAIKGKRMRLMIAGQGRPEYMDRLRRRAMRHDVMDLISWRRDRPATDELAAQCHFGIFPYKDESGMSDANVELMAAGRPQIISDGKIAREYLGSDGGAIYVDPAAAESFTDAMLRLGTDSIQRQELGRMASARYRKELSPQRSLGAVARILAD